MEKPRRHKVDYQRIKDGVPLEKLVAHFRLELRPQGNGEHRGNCPFPHHEGDCNSKGFAVNFGNSSYQCFTHCGGNKGAINFYCDMLGLDRNSPQAVHQAATELQRLFLDGQGQLPLEEGQEAIGGKGHPKTQPTPERVHRPINFHLSMDRDVPYLLQDKNLRTETLGFFDMGRPTHSKTFPDHLAVRIHDTGGDAIGYAGQSQATGEWKFPNLSKGQLLFNAHRAKAAVGNGMPLIITEGFFGCAYLHQEGFANTVAIMGLYASPFQMEKIRELSRHGIVLFLDNDPAGQKAAKRLLSQLEWQADVHCVTYPKEGAFTKPNDFPPTLLREVLHPWHPHARAGR